MAMHRLTDAKIKGLTAPGLYGDGAGLYLRVRNGGSKGWFFVFTRQGVRRELGLGGFGGTAPVTLAIARRKADEIRQQLAEGSDPYVARRQRKATKAVTFASVAERYIEEKGDWTPHTEREWRRHLLGHAASLGAVPIQDVTTERVEDALRPLWETKPATGQRVRGKLEAVLDFATVKRLRNGENPARWTGHLEHVLTSATRVTGAKHAAMPYRDVPGFLAELGDSVEERCLRLVILTAARSGEAREARWSEIDPSAKLWTIPPERTKTGKAHVVPLSEAALAVMGERSDDLVFEGARKDRPIGNAAMSLLMNAKRPGLTVHGFRSAFRDWAGDCTDYPREIAEAALAHAVGNSVERAYRRGDALEKRKSLMSDWSSYCLPKAAAK